MNCCLAVSLSLNTKVIFSVLMVFLLLLWLLFFCCQTLSISQSVQIVHVDRNGTDQPGCLFGNESCHTLGYVLNSLSGIRYSIGTHFRIVISYQHTTHLQSNLSLNHTNVELIGIGKPHIFIQSECTVQFQNFGSFSTESLVLDFANCQITFRKGRSINFKDFSLKQVHVYTKAVDEFECSFCSLVNVTLCITSIGMTSITEARVSFDKSHFQGKTNLTFKYAGVITIANSFFFKLETHILIRVYLDDVLKFNISNCKFQEITGNPFNGIIRFYYNLPTNDDLDKPRRVVISNSNFLYITSLTTASVLEFETYDNNIQINVQIINSHFKQIKVYNGIVIIESITTPIQILIINSSFTDNRLDSNYESSIIYVSEASNSHDRSINVSMSNVTFRNNFGTGISLNGISANLTNVNFNNSTALYGVGMSIRSSEVYFQNVSFKKNTGFFGGVIHILSGHSCTEFEFENNNGSTSIIFSENNVNSNMYLEDPKCVKTLHLDNYTIIKNNLNYLTTGPTSLKLNHNNLLDHIFPGQELVFPVTVVDSLGHNGTSCISIPELECELNQPCIIGNTTLKLNTKRQQILQTNERYESGLHLTATHEFIEQSATFKIKFTCAKTLVISAYLFVSMSMCPFGYVFDSQKEPTTGGGVCTCIKDENIMCSVKEGVACVRKGNWYGSMKINNKITNTTVPCTPPYCIISDPCPLNGYRDTFMKLPTTQDEQCSDLHGGVMCRGCQKQAVFTFGAIKCVSLSNCKKWMPYTVMSLAVVIQIALVMFIFLFLKHNGRFGVGYLYGPLFFLAVYKLLPLSFVSPYALLDVIVSVYHSILFLDLSIFGKIPWCFFQNINHILNYALRFVGPLVTFVLLLIIVYLARHFYRKMSFFLTSPIQAICLLMVLSFWSVSNTCIDIIKPVITNHGWRAEIEPNQEYLSDKFYITFWILSVLLIFLIYLPFILLLLFSQCLRKKINLIRIQPLLDAFQSSYREQVQWFAGIYLLAWILLNINIPSYYILFKTTILVSVCLLHFLLQPHKSKWINMSDTMLLTNLIFLTFLSFQGVNTHLASILVYVFVLISLSYILIGCVWFTCGHVFKNVVKKKMFLKVPDCVEANRTESQRLIYDVISDYHSIKGVESSEVDLFREPLIFED